MKRTLLVLAVLLTAGAVWSGTNTAPLQDQTRLQDRTKLEDQIRDRLQDRLKTQDCDQVCDKLLLQIRERTSSQKQYEDALGFMKTYMDRNRNAKDAEELASVGEFYNKNRNSTSGTLREKRNMLMSQAENMIRNKIQNGGSGIQQRQLKEQENERYSYAYQKRMRQNYISENSARANQIKQNRQGQNGSARK